MIVDVFEQLAYHFGSGGIGGVIELFVAHPGGVFHQKRRVATNFFVEELKQFILNAIVVRIVFCVDSAVEARIPKHMFVSGYLGFVRGLPGRMLESDFYWISHHLHFFWIHVEGIYFVHQKHGKTFFGRK